MILFSCIDWTNGLSAQDMDGDEEMGDVKGAGDEENGKKRKVILIACFFVPHSPGPVPASGTKTC